MPQLFLLIENKIHWLAYLITSHHLYRPINLLDVLVMAHLFNIFGVVARKIHTKSTSSSLPTSSRVTTCRNLDVLAKDTGSTVPQLALFLS
jgi:hypothetical protein